MSIHYQARSIDVGDDRTDSVSLTTTSSSFTLDDGFTLKTGGGTLDTIDETSIGTLNDELKTHVPTSYAVRSMFDLSPFTLSSDTSASGYPTFIVTLNNEMVSNMKFKFEFKYDGTYDGTTVTPIAQVQTYTDNTSTRYSRALQELIKARSSLKPIAFVEYVDGTQIRVNGVEYPNCFTATLDGTTYKINDLSFDEWDFTTNPLTSNDVIDGTGVCEYRVDTPVSGQTYASIIFEYTPGTMTIQSSSINYDTTGSQLLMMLRTFSTPMQLDLTNVTLGPNCAQLFRNDRTGQSNNIEINGIQAITNLHFASNKPTNLTGFIRNINIKNITLKPGTSVDVSECSYLRGFDQSREGPSAHDLYVMFGMKDWVLKTDTYVDVHNFMSYAGMNAYFDAEITSQGINDYPFIVSLLRNSSTPETEPFDLSNLSANGPLYGDLYYFLAVVPYYGVCIVPSMKLELAKGYGLFNYTLFTEIQGLNNIDVSDATSLNNMFLYIPFIQTIDIRSWNMDKCIEFRNFIQNCPSLSTLIINKKYVDGYADQTDCVDETPTVTTLTIINPEVDETVYMYSRWTPQSGVMTTSGDYYALSTLIDYTITQYSVDGDTLTLTLHLSSP